MDKIDSTNSNMPVNKTKTSELAIASLILGIFGLVGYYLFTLILIYVDYSVIMFIGIRVILLVICIIAVTLGSISISKIKKSKMLKGSVLAIIGIVLGSIGILIYVSMIAFLFIGGDPVR